MGLLRSERANVARIGLIFVALSGMPCMADSSSDLPAATAAEKSTSSSEQSSTTQDSSSSSTKTPSETSAAATSTTAAITQASTNSDEPVSGPLLDKRKLVLSRIMAAKKQGTGISGYMAEYGRIEQMVKAGEPETAYADRLNSLQNGVDDQIQRSQLLKTQRPTAPHPGSSAVSSSSGGSSSSSGGGGGKVGGMSIDQLKEKYGDKVPPGIAEKLGSMTPEQKEKLMNSDMLKKLLNR